MIREIIIQWLPVIVSTVGSTVISIITTKICNKIFDNSEKGLNNIKKQAVDTQNTSISILDECKVLKENANETYKKTNDLLAQVKQEREENLKVLCDIKSATEEMESIKNNLTNIKNQLTATLRREK